MISDIVFDQMDWKQQCWKFFFLSIKCHQNKSRLVIVNFRCIFFVIVSFNTSFKHPIIIFILFLHKIFNFFPRFNSKAIPTHSSIWLISRINWWWWWSTILSFSSWTINIVEWQQLVEVEEGAQSKIHNEIEILKCCFVLWTNRFFQQLSCMQVMHNGVKCLWNK